MDQAEQTFAERGIGYASIRGDQTPKARAKNIAAQTIDSKIAELIDSKSGLAARALDGADDDDGASSTDVQIEALVALLTDALAAEDVG